MLITILCTFAPGAFSDAKRLRLEHYTFLREVKHSIVEGGPLLGPDGVATAMLMVIEAETIEDAAHFIAKEPYNANRFFESVAIRHLSHVIPEPMPNFIEDEYCEEIESRTKRPTDHGGPKAEI